MTGKEFLEEMANQSKLPPRFDQNDEFLAGLLEKYAEGKVHSSVELHMAAEDQCLAVLRNNGILVESGIIKLNMKSKALMHRMSQIAMFWLEDKFNYTTTFNYDYEK